LAEETGDYAPDPEIDEQRTQLERLALMHRIVISLIDCEDRMKRGMRWDEIALLPGLGGVNVKKVLDDLLNLKYVVCTTEIGIEETVADVQINKLCELYGSTFFGRKWLKELEIERST
jgi:hypothetical protein